MFGFLFGGVACIVLKQNTHTHTLAGDEGTETCRLKAAGHVGSRGEDSMVAEQGRPPPGDATTLVTDSAVCAEQGDATAYVADSAVCELFRSVPSFGHLRPRQF